MIPLAVLAFALAPGAGANWAGPGTAAAAPGPIARGGGFGVLVHRPGSHGRWHHWPDRPDTGQDRPDYGNSYGWGGGSSGYDPAYGPPRPGSAGFFTDGDTWMAGRRVVYEYDRGYPYEHYRPQSGR